MVFLYPIFKMITVMNRLKNICCLKQHFFVFSTDESNFLIYKKMAIRNEAFLMATFRFLISFSYFLTFCFIIYSWSILLFTLRFLNSKILITSILSILMSIIPSNPSSSIITTSSRVGMPLAVPAPCVLDNVQRSLLCNTVYLGCDYFQCQNPSL